VYTHFILQIRVSLSLALSAFKRVVWFFVNVHYYCFQFLYLHSLTLSLKALCFRTVRLERLFVHWFVYPVKYCYHSISWMPWTILRNLTRNIY